MRSAETMSPENLQLLFQQIHSSWTLDTMFLFVLSPLGALSFILNIVCFVTLWQIRDRESNKVIYQYLRIYTFNSVLGTLVPTCSFLGFSPHYFLFSLDLVARYYRCVLLSLATTLYLFKNVLDVLIALERLSLLVAWLRHFKTKSPCLVSFVLFIVCALVNSPTYFLAQPKSDADFFNVTNTGSVNNYCSQLAFFKSFFGQSITFAVFIYRDFLTIIAEITFSVLAVQQLRRFRLKTTTAALSCEDARIADSERQLIVITLYILIVSLASHFIVFLSYLSFLLQLEKVFNGWLTFLALFSSSLTLGLNFFIIYFHSRVFRESFKRIFSKFFFLI